MKVDIEQKQLFSLSEKYKITLSVSEGRVKGQRESVLDWVKKTAAISHSSKKYHLPAYRQSTIHVLVKPDALWIYICGKM